MENKTEAIIQAVSGNKKVKNIVKFLSENVPFWLQAPWIETKGKLVVLKARNPINPA